MTGVVIALVLWASLLTLCCLVLSSQCSRGLEQQEEKPHPCDTCVRWWECNGVDPDCPLLEEVDDNDADR